MRDLNELNTINWAEVGDEEIPGLIQSYVRDNDERALGLIWQAVLEDGHYLTKATSYVLEFLVPLLEKKNRSRDLGIIRDIAQTCWAAIESRDLYYPPNCEPSLWSLLSLRAIEEGFDAFVGIFISHAELRLPIAFILTCFPERAAQHVAQILDLYNLSQDQFEKSELLLSLDQVSAYISNWDEMLLAALAEEGSPILQHFATSLHVVRYRAEVPRELLSVLANASPDAVPPHMFLGSMEIPYIEILGRALRALPAGERIPILAAILPRVTSTPTAQCLISYLLEGASMQPDLRLGRELGSGEYLPLGGAIIRPLRVDPSVPDWIPAIVHCEPFWRDRIELLSLFGLPSTRDGLIGLWQSVYRKPFPNPGRNHGDVT